MLIFNQSREIIIKLNKDKTSYNVTTICDVYDSDVKVNKLEIYYPRVVINNLHFDVLSDDEVCSEFTFSDIL